MPNVRCRPRSGKGGAGPRLSDSEMNLSAPGDGPVGRDSGVDWRAGRRGGLWTARLL